MAPSKQIRPLLLVDGYNVLRATPRYRALIDDSLIPSSTTSKGRRIKDERDMPDDPFERARQALVADVATFAQHKYEAVIVYDGAGNLSPERPNLFEAGVRIVFSQTGESADSVVERLCVQARRSNRKVTLVTSDNDIRSTVGIGPHADSVVKISSQLLVQEVEHIDRDTRGALESRTYARMTVEDRLSPKSRAKLNKFLRRS